MHSFYTAEENRPEGRYFVLSLKICGCQFLLTMLLFISRERNLILSYFKGRVTIYYYQTKDLAFN